MPRKPAGGGAQARIAQHLSAGAPTSAGLPATLTQNKKNVRGNRPISGQNEFRPSSSGRKRFSLDEISHRRICGTSSVSQAGRRRGSGANCKAPERRSSDLRRPPRHFIAKQEKRPAKPAYFRTKEPENTFHPVENVLTWTKCISTQFIR